MQSSVAANGIPQKAIDGSTSTFFNQDTCSMTQTERSPWWYVNLLEPYMVQLVRLDFGTACCCKFLDTYLMLVPFFTPIIIPGTITTIVSWIFFYISANNRPATIVVRVGNNRPDLGVNPICNKYNGFIGKLRLVHFG